MRVVLQRVSEARVRVDGRTVGEIGPGLLLLCAFQETDSADDLAWMAAKCADLRVFADEAGKMNLSLRETGGAALVVSQFTLYGNSRKGRRPSFIGSAPAELAARLYDEFIGALLAGGIAVESGVFQAMMAVELVNDGPVTLILDRP
jgi:D-tyrosyl-tRNA(Tyr) deacylase